MLSAPLYSPTYNLFRFLAQTLQPLIGKSESHITNLIDFKKNRLCTPTHLLVSFDVESLFTQVPIRDTLNIIKASHEVSSDFIPLIKHCLTTYFSYNNKFYEQTSRVAWALLFFLLSPKSSWNILRKRPSEKYSKNQKFFSVM